ncbi:MAG: FAD:protein FMN transferase [Verrucomicrobiaceae bacterium]|nr:FAD:protein FMN transferase [Verrucomicrobiaceae bacterium]
MFIVRRSLSVARRMAVVLAILAPAFMGSDAGGLHAAQEERFTFEAVEMGTLFRITLYASDKETAEAASTAARTRVEALNAALSDYLPESEINRLSNSSGHGTPVHVSDDLWNVLALSQSLADKTDGAFDVTVGPLVKTWKHARRNGKLPAAELLERMRARTGWRNMILDAVHHTVELRVPDMQLDVGGMAKGYAVDEALKVLRRHGVTRALVAAGGDIAASGAPPGEAGWRIMITPLDAEGAPPPRFVMLRNSAVSTSGDTHQRVEIDGVRYSHIVDPRTGLGITDHSLVSVLAPNCTTTDLLETTVTVLGPERGLKLIEATPRTAAFIIRKPADKIETFESSRWHELAGEDAAVHGRSKLR